MVYRGAVDMTAAIASHTAVEHTCRVDVPFFADRVMHVVTTPCGPVTTTLSDFRDGGFDVVAVGVLEGEVEGFPEVGGYPRGRHLLLRS